MEKRKLNMQFAKGGSGSRTTRLTLPVSFIDKLGVTADNREVNVIYVNGKIIITKEEYTMNTKVGETKWKSFWKMEQ